MQDGNYPPRNFATFGLSGLQPPLTGTYKTNVNLFTSSCSTGQVSDFIRHNKISQNLMFLLNSRYPLLFRAKKLSFSLSYGVNLPSSLTFFILFAFIFSTHLHAFEWYSMLSIFSRLF